jgi:alkylhydroperoxidase/carboxymuconolactone decarboxylase family protein YurZ
MAAPKSFLEILKDNDPEYHALVQELWDKTQAPGSLDAKTRSLMVILIDAMKGQKEAVKAVADRARSQGATDGEIRETVRLAFMAAGVSGLSAGVCAFPEE